MTALEELLSVAVSHERALQRALRAGEDRAVSVYRARQAGVTLAEIARVLQIPRSTVPPLARRGAQLATAMSDSPRSGSVSSPSEESVPAPVRSYSPESGPGSPSPESNCLPDWMAAVEEALDTIARSDSPESAPDVHCVRAGCPAAALPGGRFCAAHALA